MKKWIKKIKSTIIDNENVRDFLAALGFIFAIALTYFLYIITE